MQEVTGLAFDARNSELWFLTTTPELVRASVPRGALCPQVVSRCPLAGVIPPGMQAAGLEVSEKHGLIFYAASLTGSAPVNLVLIAPLTDPCRVQCAINLGRPFGAVQNEPITGLAFDDCDDELFAVAGGLGMVRARIAFPACTLGTTSSCTPPGNYRFHGLALQPPGATVTGNSCAMGACPACPGARLRANEPSLGNAGFGFTIGNLPAGGVAIPIVGFGPCGSGIAALCGRFHPPLTPALIVLPALPITGPSTCTGGVRIPLPLAADGSLCGIEFCMQAVIGCPAGGFALSNALGVRIVGA